jgi:hypothetical protein
VRHYSEEEQSQGVHTGRDYHWLLAESAIFPVFVVCHSCKRMLISLDRTRKMREEFKGVQGCRLLPPQQVKITCRVPRGRKTALGSIDPRWAIS